MKLGSVTAAIAAAIGVVAVGACSSSSGGPVSNADDAGASSGPDGAAGGGSGSGSAAQEDADGGAPGDDAGTGTGTGGGSGGGASGGDTCTTFGERAAPCCAGRASCSTDPSVWKLYCQFYESCSSMPACFSASDCATLLACGDPNAPPKCP